MERPLLTITCADVGLDPSKVEQNLTKFFTLAKAWNAILLIDEADIFMEHRKVQDIKRNSLVAGFLRAMEYFQGILFLTTNRVGTFDEAFISRINLSIYYPAFTTEVRRNVWESFFKKLERDKEGTMRVHDLTRAYVEETTDFDQLQWSGRDIRNGQLSARITIEFLFLTDLFSAFQIAVALAETKGDKDARGNILIMKEHIRTTVDMSKSFKQYLKALNKKDEDAMAAMKGLRNDVAFSTQTSGRSDYR